MPIRKHQIFIGSCLPTCTSDQRFIYLVIGFILGIIAYVVVEYVIFGRKKLVDEDLLADNHKIGNNNHNEFNNLGKN